MNLQVSKYKGRKYLAIVRGYRDLVTKKVKHKVVFYSRDYDKKATADRANVVQKARDMELNPAKFNRATSYGDAKYMKNLAFDKKTPISNNSL